MKKNLFMLLILTLLSIQSFCQISNETATKLVSSYLTNLNSDSYILYRNKEIVNKGSVIYTFDKSFCSDFNQSYLFFLDENPLKNWSHSCSYLFVDVKSGIIKTVKWKLPPNNISDWDMLTKFKEDSDIKLFNLKKDESELKTTSQPSDKCYAVIISGGYNKDNNWQRYWNDCSAIYSALVNVYDFADDHIYSLISDGTSSSDDRRISGGYDSSPLDLDGDGDNDIQYSATKANITTVFNTLAANLDYDDHLFIFFTDHGDIESGTDVLVYLWGESMKDDEFATEVNKVNAGQISVVLEQCYSGGFIDDLTGTNRIISTACDFDETSCGMGLYSYDEFVFDWISAIAGEDPNGNPVDADTNNDSFVSMLEAFTYAEANDGCTETPQYNSTPENLGGLLGLGFSLFSSGQQLICSTPNSTISFNNRPSGTTIHWDKSSNLVYVSGQGTDDYVVRASASSGSGWVQPTIYFSTDSVILPQYPVWVGTPVVSVTGPDEGYPNVQYTFQAHTANPTYTYPFSYSWDMYPYDGYISTSQGGNYAAYGYFTFYNVYSASGYWVKARAQNDCGTGAYGQTNIWIHDYWKLSPNPASEIATLTRVVSESDNTKMISSDGENTTCDIQILDYYGSLQYQATKSGDSFTIPVNNLKDGTYFVKITQGKQTTNLKLVVKH